MRLRAWLTTITLGAAAAGLAGGCASTEEQLLRSIDPKVPEPALEDAYYIQAGDVFNVKIFSNPNLNETLMVRPDGRISMQLIDDIMVAGKTPAEVDRMITEAYSTRLRDPEVAVIMREFSVNKIFVGGEVLSPRIVDLRGPMTVSRAIFQAGGQKNTATLSSVLVVRHVAGQRPKVLNVDVDDILDRDPRRPAEALRHRVRPEELHRAGGLVRRPVHQPDRPTERSVPLQLQLLPQQLV